MVQISDMKNAKVLYSMSHSFINLQEPKIQEGQFQLALDMNLHHLVEAQAED